MAGIEKICEFSGEHCGSDMYSWKTNHIQVKPEFRNQFRGCSHVLEIKTDEARYQDRFGSSMCRKGYAEDGMCWGKDFSSESEANKFYKRMGYRPVTEYVYTLIVEDKHLQGNVEGRYINYTTNLGTMLRKMKRLVGGDLNVKRLYK